VAATSGLRFEPIGPEIRDALEEYLNEFRAVDTHGPFDLAEENGFAGVAGYIEFCRLAAGETPPVPGLVRTDALALLRDGRVLGEIRIRHRLTPDLEIDGGHLGYRVRPSERNRGYATAMLREGLARLRALGLERALLTVDGSNAPSLRVVEKCGGVGRDEVPEGSGPLNRRFWIATAPLEGKRGEQGPPGSFQEP